MKIFGKESELGNKALNIVKLFYNGFLIPNTIIIERKKIGNINVDKLLYQNKKYILRPSFEIEDSNHITFAGYFKSIFPLYKDEVIEILKNIDIEKKFNGEGFRLKSLIIQEFVETELYGVYFTRNPNNIFLKGYYEVGKTNEQITSGNKKSSLKLPSIQEKEIEIIGKKLERIFQNPQDIEFCIKNNKIILLQTRPITTGNYTIYNFSTIQKINGIYTALDFDELGEKSDYFSYKVLNGLFDCIYLDSRIYFKNKLFPYYLFKTMKVDNYNLKLFYKNYKYYLLGKIIFNFIKFFIGQKLDLKVLNDFFKDYKYSFLLSKKSNLKLKFNYKTNFITRLFLKLETMKNLAFYYLEQYKKEYKGKNFIEKQNYNFHNKLIFLNGILLKFNFKKEKYNWIYKGTIKGVITNLKNFKYKKGLNQVLIIEDLNLKLYDKLEYLNGVIIKNGNSLSHNSIVLREYKIPSIINYKQFNSLKNGDQIIIDS